MQRIQSLIKVMLKPNTTIGCILLLWLAVGNNLYSSKDFWKGIVRSDGIGYYAYLPAIFCYHDLSFSFYPQIEKTVFANQPQQADFMVPLAKGKVVNKYYVGTAVLLSPFFLMAHVLAMATDLPANGYSSIYYAFVLIASVLYASAGLCFIAKLLELLGISSLLISVSLWVISFGTNLFYYVLIEPAMSHAYSFSLVAGFLYVAVLYIKKPEFHLFVVLTLLLALIILVRPVNALVIFSMPFLHESVQNARATVVRIVAYRKRILIALLVFFSIVSVQSWLYYVSTSKWWVYSYGNEGFNFFQPHFIDILFSYKKGLFLYTPFYLISLTGIVALWPSNRWQALTGTLFFILITWVLSSWWNWYYGGSFSGRVFVDYLPFFTLLFAVSMQKLSNRFRIALMVVSFFITILCQFQIYQYRYDIIHYSEMTKEKYWQVFLKFK